MYSMPTQFQILICCYTQPQAVQTVAMVTTNFTLHGANIVLFRFVQRQALDGTVDKPQMKCISSTTCHATVESTTRGSNSCEKLTGLEQFATESRSPKKEWPPHKNHTIWCGG